MANPPAIPAASDKNDLLAIADSFLLGASSFVLRLIPIAGVARSSCMPPRGQILRHQIPGRMKLAMITTARIPRKI
jgi:hypothetical protein